MNKARVFKPFCCPVCRKELEPYDVDGGSGDCMVWYFTCADCKVVFTQWTVIDPEPTSMDYEGDTFPLAYSTPDRGDVSAELLEALESLPLDEFGDDMSKHDAADFIDHAGSFFTAMVRARAAIAKAKGE